MRALVPAAALTAALALGACGASSPSTAPAATQAPSPTFTALSLPDACHLLRRDIINNGGSPDAATLRKVIGHSTDGHLIDDAQGTLKDLRKPDNGIVLGLDLAFLYRDCKSTGVQIPQLN